MEIKGKSENNTEKATYFFFLIYLVVLSWAILFKFQLNVTTLVDEVSNRRIIWRPYLGESGIINRSDVIFNIIAFIPYGFYFSSVGKKRNTAVKVLIIFMTSVFYETAQYVFAIGCTDITDIINNTLGGLIGILIYFIFSKVLKTDADRAVNIMARISTGVFFLLLFIGTETNL